MNRVGLSQFVRPTRAPAVLMTFDDGGGTQYSEGFVYANAAGLKGTIYINTDLVNVAGYVTTANLTAMQSAGWDVANHTSDHTNLTTLSQVNVEAKLTAARDWLNSNGFSRGSRHVAYPYGASNSTVLAAMDSLDMLTGRGIVEAMDTAPTNNLYAINSYILDKTKSLATAQGLVDNAITNKKVLSLYIHSINSSPGNFDLSITTFRGFVDYVVSTGIRTITISELYNGILS